MNLELEKTLNDIKNKNLSSIQKVKNHGILPLENKKQLVLNQTLFELLNFHFEMNESLILEYRKQKEKFDLDDVAYTRTKMQFYKNREKLKFLKKFLNVKATNRLA